jgi:two-component system response regulator WspF
MKIAIATADRVRAEALRRALASDARHRVAWVARDSVSTAALAASDRPDLLLLDPELPALAGVPLTRHLVLSGSCPILLCSARATAVDKIYDALGFGAIDSVAAPTMSADGELSGQTPFLARLATVERLAPAQDRPADSLFGGLANPDPSAAVPLVAIGASTGGPAALATILERLPADLEAALVIVQHIDDGFAEGLASWLSERCRFPVRTIKPGTQPQRGQAYLAATGEHLVVDADRRLVYTPEPAQALHRPAIDVFFNSLAASPSPGLAILLTGMGRDGADGLLRLRRAGWTTVAQDEHSAVVYGMPRAAAEIGAAEQVLPLAAIASTITGFAARAGLRG